MGWLAVPMHECICSCLAAGCRSIDGKARCGSMCVDQLCPMPSAKLVRTCCRCRQHIRECFLAYCCLLAAGKELTGAWGSAACVPLS